MQSLPLINLPDRPNRPRPRMGVFKFASCDGCQLSLLDCEDELLAVADRVEIAFFREATRRPLEGTFDIALVEGSVSVPEQEEAIRDIRQRSRFLICLGACASHGGIQALRNFGSTAAAPGGRLRDAANHRDTGQVATGRLVRPRRPGAARMPDRQAAAPRCPGADAGRQPATNFFTIRSAWTASDRAWSAYWLRTAHRAWAR